MGSSWFGCEPLVIVSVPENVVSMADRMHVSHDDDFDRTVHKCQDGTAGACYSMRDNVCRYPCRDQLDDMPAFHEMVIAVKGVIITSPINGNNMSSRLKDFLDRLNCIQNLYLLKRPGLTEAKIVGIAVSGHEDGATKIAMDIFLYFRQTRYLLAPFGIAYRVHGAQFNTITDMESLKSDPLVIQKVKGMTTNVMELIRLDNEGKLKGKLVPVCE